jgi:tetratricopeptide (TPR) repeat protein
LEQAIPILEELVRANPDVILFEADLAGAYQLFGTFQAGSDNWRAALAAFHQARFWREKLVRDHPTVIRFRGDLVDLYHSLGANTENVQTEAARHYYRLACINREWLLHEKLREANPVDTRSQSELAAMYRNLAHLQDCAGDRAASQRSYEQAYALHERLIQANPAMTLLQHEMATTCLFLGNLHTKLGQSEAALPYLKQAGALWDQLVQGNPTRIEFRQQLDLVLYHLSEALAKSHRGEEAVAVFREVLSQQRLAVTMTPEVPEHLHRLSEYWSDIAGYLRQLDQPGAAMSVILERRKLWPTNATELFRAAGELALCIPLVGKGKSALTADEQAERRKYADLAMETLRQAVAAGFTDGARLKTEEILDPLRGRADFQRLLAELEMARPGGE